MTKVVILAGGLGTRLSEETVLKPKPMVEIGGRPILWHIMKFYAAQGFKDFIICAGYKQNVIKEYFANYHLHQGDVTFDLSTGAAQAHTKAQDDWRVTVVDTGETTMTGGRLKRIKPFLNPHEPFFMTYGDGLANVDLAALYACHKEKNVQITLTAVSPPPRFGELDIQNGLVTRFMEKQGMSERRINGGYMVIDPAVLDRIAGDDMPFEQEPLRVAAEEGRLAAFEHDGFWMCMDKLHDKNVLESIWDSGQAPWKIWT